LADEPKRVDVVERCEQMTQSLLGVRGSDVEADELVKTSKETQHIVRGASASYTLRATLVPSLLSSARPCAVVVVAPRHAQRRSAEELRERYGLTQREVEVAYLLAGRKRQRELAEILGISVHTARRHTERVLQKLGIGRREQVRAVVMRDP